MLLTALVMSTTAQYRLVTRGGEDKEDTVRVTVQNTALGWGS